jgi:transglutaminase-like putative cysteine protease
VSTSPSVLDLAAPGDYLAADEIIECEHPAVGALGDELRRQQPSDVDFARAAFDWVRDNVARAYDVQDRRVTLTASEVLNEGVGLRYAKSNLLAAVLRSQGIPTGLCYQRLGSPEEGYFVHGLVYLEEGWHRQDPRGNKPGVDARFSLEEERLAYVVDAVRGERDYRRIYQSAAPVVVAALRSATDILTSPLPADLPV